MKLKLVSLLFCLVAFMLPLVSFAQPVEIPLASLSEEQQMEVVNLTYAGEDAFVEEDYDTALAYIQKALSMATDYAQAEYDLARIYQETGRCYNAYYHFERLSKRDLEDSEIKSSVKKHFKTVKRDCGDAVDFQITCKTPGAMLSIPGFSTDDIPCPIYTKVKAGAAYPLVVKKEGFFEVKDTILVEGDSYIREIPELKSIASVGVLSVICPKGYKSFHLTNQANGQSAEHPCPWEGKVDSGTYKIRLEGKDADELDEIVVASEGQTAYKFAAGSDSACVCSSVSRSSNTAFPVLATVFGALAFLFLGLRRRREN